MKTYYSDRFDCKEAVSVGNYALVPAARISVGFKTAWPAGGSTIIGLKTRCLDVYAYSTANGASVVGWGCGAPNGNPNQQWTMVGSEIRGYGNKCLDAWNGGGNGAPAGMWDCNGNPWQQWTRYSDGTIVNNYYGRCLDLASYGVYNGVPLQLWDCYYGGNQVFKSDL